ncbi:glycosyltransferase 61 family protein [Epibacterium ulvae]|uniref:glycosyltransferase 61 family protein n=1 Tax=Epibacterium ulvae TaxID=1156985 RepID=UPI00248F46FD|nr:glycosyltransferase 61 family protein [Epibacterium ulvae]
MTDRTLGAQDKPSPEGGWSETCVTLNSPYVVPPLISGLVQPAGILAADGSYCDHGALWRRHRSITTQPDMPSNVPDQLEGRWLWGGVLWAHFGHFLVESTSRLWALDDLSQDIDGILFIPKRPSEETEIRGFHRRFVDLIAPGLPIRVANQPTRVEELIVPGQGYGLGQIISGTQRFRNFIESRFACDIAPEGPDKLYISRSKLGLRKGGLLGEEQLETLLEEQGYTIFHPQDHSLDVQLARYKAADKIVAVDGSALHLYAMVGRSDQKVAMILRRMSGASQQLVDNVSAFTGCGMVVVNALRTEWLPIDQQKSNRLSFGELDHSKVAMALRAKGFIAADSEWPALNNRERRKLLWRKGIREDENFVESPEFRKKAIREMRQKRRARRAARLASEGDQSASSNS